MEEQKGKPKIEVDLYSLLEELLGIHDCIYLGKLKSLSEVIQFKLNQSKNLLYCIRDFDNQGNPISGMLWRYDAWVSCSSRWERIRHKAEVERTNRFIDDENIKAIVHRIQDDYALDTEHATKLAYKWIKEGKIKMLDGVKLKERIKE